MNWTRGRRSPTPRRRNGDCFANPGAAVRLLAIQHTDVRPSGHHVSGRVRGRPSNSVDSDAGAHERRCLFGRVRRGRMGLNEYGRIVVAEWRRSEALRYEVVLDAFVVMPNLATGQFGCWRYTAEKSPK